MPVVISKKDPTNPQKGIIHISDVHRMLTDYRRKITIDCIDSSRNPVQKRFHFDIDLERLKKIAGKIPGTKKIIRVNLSVTLPGQLNCDEDDSIENSLSILVCGINNDKPMLKEGNLILVEGFTDNSESKIEGNPCCVQGIPIGLV